MSDLIRRSDVLDLSYTHDTHDGRGIEAVDEESIMSIPAVDAVEGRHGEWIEFGEPNDRGEYEPWYWMCSECAAVGLDTFNYCHKCGARMDGEEENNAAD